jgi:hypothetical protein
VAGWWAEQAERDAGEKGHAGVEKGQATVTNRIIIL